MAYEFIILEKKDGVAKIIINRPKQYNMMSIATLAEMNSALEELEKDQDIKVITITGAGEKAFAAGVEVADHLGDKLYKMLEEFDRLFKLLRGSSKVTIAVVNGVALGGGCEVVAGCDVAIASDKATLGQPEIQLGTYPGIAGVLFHRIMGNKKAFELIMSGESISAKEAEQIGLVNKVVPAEELEKAADEFAGRFLGQSGLILAMAKDIFYQSADIPDYEPCMKKTMELCTKLMETEDAKEGLNSFLERRKPVWQNK